MTRIASPLNRHERLARISANIRRFGYLPRFAQRTHDAGPVTICGFGPSLADTWRSIRGPICTTSGAHDFLIARRVIPAYHVECDPRAHKVEFLRHPHPAVTYLINSQCHPAMFEALLPEHNVVMWHSLVDEDAEALVRLLVWLEPDARLMTGGTNAGMRAMPLMRDCGHTGFDLHGFDCCYHGAQQWAGEHHTAPHNAVTIGCEGERFETSDLMMQATDDFFNQLRFLQGCRFRIHGGGLLEARLKLYHRDPEKALSKSWWRPVSFSLKSAA